MFDFRKRIAGLGDYGRMVTAVGRDLLRGGVNLRDLAHQMAVIGTASIPVVLMTALFTGMVLCLQTAFGLYRFGAKNYVGHVVSLALVRELGPVLTAVMLCGRVGAGIAAEIGSMVVTEQVDAIRALGADPIRKLVTPRIAAAVIVVPCLVMIAIGIGLYGGLLVSVYDLDVSVHRFYRGVLYVIVIRDLVDSLIKSCIFGFLLTSIACYYGLRTRGGTEGVGRATTTAVVTSSVVVFTSDYFLTKALLMLGG